MYNSILSNTTPWFLWSEKVHNNYSNCGNYTLILFYILRFYNTSVCVEGKSKKKEEVTADGEVGKKKVEKNRTKH